MDHDKENSLRAWFGLRNPFDFRKARWLGALCGVALYLIVGGLFALAVIAAFKMLGTAVFGVLPEGAKNSFGLSGIIVAMISAPFVLWRAWVAHRQADVAEENLRLQQEAHFETRLEKALENMSAFYVFKSIGRSVSEKQSPHETRFQKLSAPTPLKANDIKTLSDWTNFEETKPNVELRVAGVSEMEGLAKEGVQKRLRIQSLLNGYLRENAASKTTSQSPRRWYQEKSNEGLTEQQIYDHYGQWPKIGDAENVRAWARSLTIRADLNQSMQVMGRLGRIYQDREATTRVTALLNHENLSQDFSDTNLQALTLQNTLFSGSRFANTSLEACKLQDSTFEHCTFTGSHLDVSEAIFATFDGCNFTHAEWVAADWQRVDFKRCDLHDTRFTESFLVNIVFNHTKLSHSNFLESNIKDTTFRNCTTVATKFTHCFLENCTFEACDAFSLIRFNRTGLYNVDLRALDVTQDQIDACFGDISVLLPETISRPDNWPKQPLGPDIAYHQYTQWRTNPDQYHPPSAPIPSPPS